MPNKPRILFPTDGDTVPVTNDPRVFVAQGKVVFDNAAPPAGLNGHLLAAGTNTVKATGALLSWHRSGRRDNVFHWSLLFEIGLITGAVPDGAYDLLVSTYTGTGAVKTAAENNSSSKTEGLILATAAALAIGVTYPAPNGAINKNMFMPYGSFTNDTKPARLTMTETTSGAACAAGTVFASGTPNGYWYAAFGPLTTGNYVLDLGATAPGGADVAKSVAGLTTS